MQALAERVEQFLGAPVASAVFVLADRGGMDADALANPALITALACSAIADLSPWVVHPGSARLRAEVVHQVGRLRTLVREVLSDPRNAWWQQPAVGLLQVQLVDQRARSRGRGTDPIHVSIPIGAPGPMEAYDQRPSTAVVTSTVLPVPDGEAIASGGHGELAFGYDADVIYPVTQTRLEVHPRARVFEITAAADWHALVLNYGDPSTYPGSDRSLLECGAIDHGMAPVWSAVAADYDGVHLTFAGLLSGLLVPVTTGTVSTTLWNWTYECTRWLRTAFTTIELLPPLTIELQRPQLPRLW